MSAYTNRLDEQADRDLEVLARSKIAHAVAVQVAPKPQSDTVELIDFAKVKPEPIRWLWPGWLARGKLHVLAGAPGTGKTTLALDWGACISSGRALPDGHRPPRGRVLVWSGEDDVKDTLAPRLIAAHADMTRIRAIGGVMEGGERFPFDPARDVDKLAGAIAGMDDLAMIVIDPLVSAVTGDSHKNAEVRRGLQPLVDLAMRVDAALVGITHYSKGTQGREPLERVTGSLAFGALARVVFGTVRMQDDDEAAPRRLMLARAKSNIGPDGGGFTYAFEQVELADYGGMDASRIVYGGAVEGSARELLAEAEPESGQDDAAGFLRELLVDGSMPAKDVYREADNAGFSRDQMKRAKARAGVETAKEGGYFSDGKQRWVWRLIPEGSGKTLKGADSRECSLQGKVLPSGGDGNPADGEGFEL